MRPTEHLQMIGPWGWLGWALFAMACLFAYRLWSSDPATAMRKMRVELDAARQTISELRQLETQLKNRNEELHTQVNRLEADNRDLHQKVGLLTQAKELQGESLARMERHQHEIQDKYDNMVARVMHLEAKQGTL